jgi:hypothetical protein
MVSNRKYSSDGSSGSLENADSSVMRDSENSTRLVLVLSTNCAVEGCLSCLCGFFVSEGNLRSIFKRWDTISGKYACESDATKLCKTCNCCATRLMVRFRN